MPKIPKTLPAQLRQYYRTAPRPASAYGDDVFNFAADRLGRRNRAMQDLEDLDRYAMEQQARGRYRPDELNALAQQIEADRMMTEMDFNEFMAPRYKRYRDYAEAEARRIHDMANRALLDANQGGWEPYGEEFNQYYNGVANDAIDAYFDTREAQYLVDWENANLAPLNYRRYVTPGYPSWAANPKLNDIQPIEGWSRRLRRFENNRGNPISPTDWRESFGNKRYR